MVVNCQSTITSSTIKHIMIYSSASLNQWQRGLISPVSTVVYQRYLLYKVTAWIWGSLTMYEFEVFRRPVGSSTITHATPITQITARKQFKDACFVTPSRQMFTRGSSFFVDFIIVFGSRLDPKVKISDLCTDTDNVVAPSRTIS